MRKTTDQRDYTDQQICKIQQRKEKPMTTLQTSHGFSAAVNNDEITECCKQYLSHTFKKGSITLLVAFPLAVIKKNSQAKAI